MSTAWRCCALALLLLIGWTVAPQAAADPLADAQVLEEEVENGCLKDLDPKALITRVAALKATLAAKPEALYATAPSALLAVARLARIAHDYPRARDGNRSVVAHLPMDELGHAIAAAELEAIDREEQAMARGLTPPAPGWILSEAQAVPLPGVHRAEAAIWTGPDCSVAMVSDGPYQLQLYIQATLDQPLAPAGEPMADDEQLFFDAENANQDVTGTGATMVALTGAIGGNCWACERLRLFRVAVDGLEELTLPGPDFVVAKKVERLGGDGPPLLAAVDSRWEGFGDVCHACAPGSWHYYRWQADRFVEACSAAADRYRQSRAEAADALAKEKESADYAFGYAVSRLLDGIQLGLIDQAWAELEADLKRVRALPKAGADAFAEEQETLRDAIDRARATMTGRGCPLLDLELSDD